MAEIDNPQARRLVCERIRPLADMSQMAFRGGLHVRDEFGSVGYTAYIPNTGDTVKELDADDGRIPLTGEDVHLIVEGWETLINLLSSDPAWIPFLVAINKAAMNGTPRF